MSESPVLLIKQYKRKDALINIGNSKKSTKSSAIHNSKFLAKYSFFLYKFISRQFFMLLLVFYTNQKS